MSGEDWAEGLSIAEMLRQSDTVTIKHTDGSVEVIDQRSKDELAQAAGLKSYDTALPQDWLDGVVRQLVPVYDNWTPMAERQAERLATYDAIRMGVVWSYDTARMFGAPVALTDEANRLLSLLDQ